MRNSVGLAALLALLAVQQTIAQTDFRYERPIQTGGSGPRRLAVDVTLLAGGRPFVGIPQPGNGLADLRLFDASGKEVSYLLVANPPEEPLWSTVETQPIAPVETPTLKTSGFEVDLGSLMTVDRLRLEEMNAPFLKSVRLEGSGDRSRWTLLVNEGTVFDLPDDRLKQTELEFTPGSYRYLRLTWDDTRSGRLPRPASASARIVRSVVLPPPLMTPLVFERRPSEPGHSQFRVRLPAGRLPIVALDLNVGGGHILRDAAVFEARLVGGEVLPSSLGASTLKRVVQGDLTASELRIPITTPIEPQLDLVIDDGNNAPIDLKGVTAVFAPLPWIYFESPGDAIVARYGNSSLQTPRYDLEAVRTRLVISTMPEATWGEARMRPPAENVSGIAPALPTVGSVLDVNLFRYLRPIAPGDAGLVTVPLDAPVLAHSQSRGFADVRVLDGIGRQIPYLVERASEPLSLDVTLERVSTRPATLPPGRTLSVYRLQLPLENLPSPRLVLTTSARVFTRQIMVGVEHAPDRNQRDPWFETFATTNWEHADQDADAPALTLGLRQMNSRDVLVVLEEGDNSPLPIVSARLLLPAYRLRLFRERGVEMRLAYGRDDLSAPRYDLALLAPQLIGVAATEVTPGPEQAAPPSSSSVLMSPRLFWGVLIAAVLVLVGLVVRLVRKTDAETTPAV